MEKVVVIGTGVMGHGIAQVFAMEGFQVTIVGRREDSLQRAIDRIRWSLTKLAEKQRITKEGVDGTLSRIQMSTKITDSVRDANLVIEAVIENLELKKELFKDVDKYAPSKVIMATNTSTIPITKIAEATSRPEQFIGLHFMNPPQLMQLVEVVKGEKTCDETVNKAVEYIKKIKRTPVVCRKDVAGFIVNRISSTFLNEGFWAVYNNEVTKEEVDVVVRSSGFPMGIFELADLIGLDQLIMGMKVIEQAYGKRAKVCPIIEDYVKQNKFGVKSGEGFYDYRAGKTKIRYNGVPRFDINRVYAVTANEAAMLIQEDVATVQDIDIAMRLGFNWSLGPCERADDVGIDIIVSTLKSLYAKYGWERYSVAPLLQDYVKAGKLGRRTGSGFYVRNT